MTAQGDLHAKIWEGHWMVFDPNVCQDTRISVAHQLQLVNISFPPWDLVPKYIPSDGDYQCNDLHFRQHDVVDLVSPSELYRDDNAKSAGYPPTVPLCPGSSPRKSPVVACSGNATDVVIRQKPYSRRQSPVPA